MGKIADSPEQKGEVRMRLALPLGVTTHQIPRVEDCNKLKQGYHIILSAVTEPQTSYLLRASLIFFFLILTGADSQR